MSLAEDFFKINLFTIRRCIAGKAHCKAHDTIPAAHRLRRAIDSLGRTDDARIEKLLEYTKLEPTVTALELLEGIIAFWWCDLKQLIEPYDRAAHEKHPRSLPQRRKYKKASEYWAKYMFTKRSEFESVQKRFKCKDVEFPYLTVVGTIFEVQLANNSISEWPLKSNVFDINDEDPIEGFEDECI